MAVERKKFSFDEEKFVIINLILSSELCREVLSITNPDYFKSRGIKVIIGWMKSHYTQYGEALQQKINDYYEINASSLEANIQEQIGNILTHLSDIASTEVHNVAYLKDRATALYRKKFYEQQIKVANEFVEKGQLDNAEKALSERFQTSDSVLSGAKKLYDPEMIAKSLRIIFKEEEADPFFKFEGRFGDFISALEPGWLVTFIAPPKTGKTVMLMETVITAIMQRKNVVFFSLEMPIHQILARFLRRITGLATPTGGDFYVPVFDCFYNQNGSCSLPQRAGYGDIVDHEAGPDSILPFDEEITWEVCSECRGTKDFRPSSWKVKVTKAPVSEVEFRKMVGAFMRYYEKYCRIIFHPSKTMDAKLLNEEIDLLIMTENFIPDIIAIDYADLMKPEGGKGNKRLELDDIWESLRSTGQVRMATTVTASQTNKGGVDAPYIRQQDIAEDFSKLAKVDIGIGLAQPEELKDRGILNANIVAHRHEAFLISKVCTILQDSAAMQGHLDSDY